MTSQYKNLPQLGVASWRSPIALGSDLPLTGNTPGDAIITTDTDTLWVWTGSTWLASAGATGVSSLNSLIGSLSIVAGAGGIVVTPSGTDITLDILGPAREFATFNETTGALEGLPEYQFDPTTFNGQRLSFSVTPGATNDYRPLNNSFASLNPTVNNSTEFWQNNTIEVGLGTDDSGNQVGDLTGGGTGLLNLSFFSRNKSSFGDAEGLRISADIGNGTDLVTGRNWTGIQQFITLHDNTSMEYVRGVGVSFGEGGSATDRPINHDVRAFVSEGGMPHTNIGGGYIGFSTGFEIKSALYGTAFQTNMNIPAITQDWTSFQDSGTFGTISGGGYNGLSLTPVITETQYTNMVYVHPTIADAHGGSYGVFVDMSGTTPHPGVQSSLVIQDLTLTFIQPGDNNALQIQYLNDGTAGAETVGIAGQLISVHMQSGVSTATQIRAAMLANSTFHSNIASVISGTGSNAQVSQAATHFTGGVNAGLVKAAYFKGDVQVEGAFSFTGALSIGAINSNAPFTLVDGGGSVSSASLIITSPTAPANATIANADFLGVNTAMLLNIGDNATITTGFLGISALGLPAVATIGAGASVDRVAGATFALSLDSGASGVGTIDTVALCRSLAIPNGVTVVNRLYGYEMGLPFGSVGTAQWGLYIAPAINNWLAGSLKIGGSDTPSNSSVAIEIGNKKFFANASGTTAERDALTPTPGCQWFNLDTDKLQVYAASTWQDLN